MAKNSNTIYYIAGALVLGGVLYGWLTNRKKTNGTSVSEAERLAAETNQDPMLLECGLRLSAFTGLMNVPNEVAKYQSKLPCLKLIDSYIQKYQPQEYAKLVVSGAMNEDQAKASLTIDVETINMALRSLETA